MLRNTLILSTIIMALAFLVPGCSGNPVTPQVSDETTAVRGENGDVGNNHTCLGYYELVFDTVTGSVDVLPMRTADWRFNVVGVLNGTMGVSAAGVPSEADPANGLFVFDITLQHPFATKPQFSGFDVKGILMTPGTLAVGSIMFARYNETRLENADGYTRWWNPAEFTTPGWFGYTKGNLTNTPAAALTAMVNPYKLFADSLNATDDLDVLNSVPLDDDTGRAVFRAGSSNTRRYYIRFPMNPGPQVKYGYAVDVAWSAPAHNPPVEIPDDFSIYANQSEAYRIKFIDVVNSLYYDAETGNSGGYVRFYAGVRDWQGEEGSVKLQVEQVRAYAPGLIYGSVDCPIGGETIGQAFYEFEPNELAEPTGSGDVLIMTRVEAVGGPTYDQGAGPAPTGPISAWNVIKVNVEDPECVADSNNAIGEAETVELSGDVTGNLCFTEDQADYYTFEIPPGYKISGPISYIHYTGVSDINNLQLLNEDGVSLCCPQADENTNSIIIDAENPYMLPGTYYIKVSANQDTGAFKYLLETQLTLIDVNPINPVDITPDGLDCWASWVDASGIAMNTIMAAGPAGTYCLNSSYLDTQGRVRDPLTFEPAYQDPYIYYVEGQTENPSGIDMDDYTVKQAPVHHEDVISILYNVRAMTMDANYLYVAVKETTNSYLYIYNYAMDPANPVYVDKFQLVDGILKLGIVREGTAEPVLVVLSSHDIRFYDINDPNNVGLIDFLTMAGNLYHEDFDIDTANDIIVRTWLNGDDITGHMQVLRLNDTNDLINYGVVSLTGLGACVTTETFRIFVENGTKGITCYHVAGQGNIEEKDSCNHIGPLQDMDLKYTSLCTAEAGAGPEVYNVEDQDHIALTVRSYYINSPLDGFSKGDYAYFIDSSVGYSCLKVLKISGPEAFIVWAYRTLDGRGTSIANYGDMIIVGSESDNKVWVFDISDPWNPPTQVYTASYPAHVTSVAIDGSAAYAALQNGTMKIMDVSAFPTVTAAPDDSFPGELWNMQIYSHYLFATYADDLRIFDISTPLDLFYVGDHDYGGDEEIKDMVIANGGYIYLATAHSLEIIKFESTASIIHESSLPIVNPLNDLAVDWSVAYLLSPLFPPELVYVFPPDAPSAVGNSFGDYTGYASWGICVREDRLFVMHYITGLQIFDLF